MSEPNGGHAAARAVWSRVRPYMQCAWSLVWIGASLPVLNFMAFHYWAAGGPPSPYPEWHEAWGNVFFSAALGCWAIGGLGVWFMRDRRQSTKHNVGSVATHFALVVIVLVMGLAMFSVPGPGQLLLLASGVLGAVWAVVRLRRG